MVELRDDKEVINYIFEGRWSGLDNFAHCPLGVVFAGKRYSTSEAAFQAAKTLDEGIRARMQQMGPSQAKQFGKNPVTMHLRPDWYDVREEVMEMVVRDKFSRDIRFVHLLLRTGNAEIIEGTWWNDRIWGIDLRTGEGDNKLGNLLMKLREEYRNGKE